MAIAQLEQLKAAYDLNEDPFSPRLDAFYEGGQRSHYLEVLRHMAIFGDMVLVLTGDRGAGKSHLISQFSLEHSSDISLLSIAAESGSSTSSIHRLASLAGMDMPSDYPAQDLLELLVDQLSESYERSGKRTLLIIDDAHLLDREELFTILSVMSRLEPEFGAAILLAGLPEMMLYLEEYQHPDKDDWLHQIKMKNFSDAEVGEYLLARFKAAGFEGDSLVSESQLRMLSEQSRGIPALIHKVFCRELLGVVSSNPDTDQSEDLESEQPSRSVDQFALYGIAFALVLSFVVLAFQYDFFASSGDDETVLVEGASEAMADNNLNLETEDNESQETEKGQAGEAIATLSAEFDQARAERLSAINLAIKESEVSELDSKPSDQLNSVADSGTQLDVVEEGSVNSAEPQEELSSSRAGIESETSPVPPLEADDNDSASILAAVGTSTAGEPEVDEATSLYRSARWLLAQQGSDYTAQVLGSYSEQTAQKYVERLEGKTKHPVYYIESRYKGKLWYIALYGQFENKANAREAINNAKAEIRSQKPWIRSFDGIQSSLDQ